MLLFYDETILYLQWCDTGNTLQNRTNFEFAKGTWDLFYWCGLTLIPAWINNYIQYKVWKEIIYQFQNSKLAAIGMSIFIPHFTGLS